MSNAKTIVLAMIVKDEARIIERCLRSTFALVDKVVVCDTGSSDGTQEIIRRVCAEAGKACVVAERPWQNFGANRTEVLDMARAHGDYALMIDADEVLEYAPDFRPHTFKAGLHADVYDIECRYAGTLYQRPQLTTTRLRFRYEDVIHEFLACDHPQWTREQATGLWNHPIQDGARSSEGMVAKLRRDAATLEAACAARPDYPRYAFYLANTYWDLGEWRSAIGAYQRRVTLGGWIQEVFMSHLRIARCERALLGGEERGADAACDPAFARMTAAWLEATACAPERNEALVDLARHYRLRKRFELAYRFASWAASLPIPRKALFVEIASYEWMALDELQIAAYWTGRYREAVELGYRLKGLVPAEHAARIEANLKFAMDKLAGR